MSRRQNRACPVCGHPNPSPACWWGGGWRTCHPICTERLAVASKDYSKSSRGRLRSRREILEALHGPQPRRAAPTRPRSPESAFLGALGEALRPEALAVVPRLQHGHLWLRDPAVYWRDSQGCHVASIFDYVEGIPRIAINCNTPPEWKVPAACWAELLGISLREWRREYGGLGWPHLRPGPDLCLSVRLELTVLPRELTPHLATWLARALIAPALPHPLWTVIGPPPIALEGKGIGPGFVSPPGRLPSYLWSAAAVHEWVAVRGRR